MNVETWFWCIFIELYDKVPHLQMYNRCILYKWNWKRKLHNEAFLLALITGMATVDYR